MKTETYYILGFCFSPNDSGVTLLADGKLLFSAKEQSSNHSSSKEIFPKDTLLKCIEYSQLCLEDIDDIIFCIDVDKDLSSTTSDVSQPVFLCTNYNAGYEKFIQDQIRKALNLSTIIEIPPLFCTSRALCHNAANAYFNIDIHNENIEIQLFKKQSIGALGSAYLLWITNQVEI